MLSVGLAGKPNSGKSTFFKAATLVDVAIANYPFTTIDANHGVSYVRVKCPCKELGIAQGCGKCRDGIRFVPIELIDVAGLVPDAHLGKGLGHRFLRHIKRTRLLVMVIDLSGVDPEQPLAPLKALEAEMDAFDPGLSIRPRLVVLNKVDLLPPDYPREAVVRAYEDTGWRVFTVSAKSGAGIPDLRAALWAKAPRVETEPQED